MKDRAGAAVADFRLMGTWIRGRYARCKAWWDPHLQCSRDFIRSVIPRCESVAVLGAGALLDLDLTHLRTVTDVVHLFDADPQCQKLWKRQAGTAFGVEVIPHVGDITSAIESWTSGLPRPRNRDALETYLLELRAPIPNLGDSTFSGVISLNILGQIPLYWRDRVLRVHQQLTEAEWNALYHSMGELQAGHIAGIVGYAREWTIILSDTEYYFYHVDHSDWRVEPALFGHGRASFDRLPLHPKSLKTDTWLWHVAPQFIEADEEGEIHRVEARFGLLQR